MKRILPAAMIAVLACATAMGKDGHTVPLTRQFAKQVFPDYSAEGDLKLWELFGPPARTDYIVINGDTLRFDFPAEIRGQVLTESDYEEVARDLGVEVAAIKAIVDIETGHIHRGFNPDDSPVINFDLNVFRTMAARRKIPLANYVKTHPLVFERPDARRFGSQQAAQHQRLAQAMDIDTVAAIQGTFWGMFQIGGFNWQRCGTSSPQEFADLMSRNERDQLNLFAEFIKTSGLLKHLSSKNWSAFARGYNGPSYASHGYHTRLASAYKKHSVN
ncbi:MAG: N-acetylmuramidase family protein [Muribaculaceae bacterium]|nr:N-acetylmuramidase family protein [Muribaculaceae bacterium]